MSVTFSSVGDIIAVCQLVTQAVKAISDSRGSSLEYRDLVSLLSALMIALEHVRATIQTHSHILNLASLEEVLSDCHRYLDNHLNMIQKYQLTLRKGGSGNLGRDIAAKLKWTGKKDELTAFRQGILQYVSSLQLLLQAAGVNIATAYNAALSARLDIESTRNRERREETFGLLQKILQYVQRDQIVAPRDHEDNLELERKANTTRAYLSAAAKQAKKETTGTNFMELYDKVNMECRVTIHHRSRECRTFNQKYRDTDFDITSDLQNGRNVYLSDLAGKKVPVAPQSVSRVGAIFREPIYFPDQSMYECARGREGTEWLVAAAGALSTKAAYIDRILIARDERSGIYGAVFWRDGDWTYCVVDDSLYLEEPEFEDALPEKKKLGRIKLDQDGYRDTWLTGSEALAFGRVQGADSTWLPLLEKAFAKAHGSYATLLDGSAAQALEDLTGGVAVELLPTEILDINKFWDEELMKIMTQFIFVAQLRSNEGSIDAAELMIIQIAEYKGERLIKLFDPKGEYKWTGCWSDGAEQWTPESMQSLGHRFGHDGVFWMSYKDLLRSSKLVTRVRLLDSDWKIAQLTAAVEVPWIEGYLTDKFSFTLDKSGSVIIVLSQLDRRYFNGLDDNYKFRLKFGISQTDTEEILFQSRPYHRHERSVAMEIELEAGNYDVDLGITALKNPNARSLSDIVQANTGYKRSALFAAAFSHDLAHTKAYGWLDLQEKRKNRRLEKQAERQRGATQKASTKDYYNDEYSGHTSQVASLGEEAEGWDPICAVCLRVYVKNDNDVTLHFIPEKSEAGGIDVVEKLSDLDVSSGTDLEDITRLQNAAQE